MRYYRAWYSHTFVKHVISTVILTVLTGTLLLGHDDDVVPRLELTANESAWLAAHPVVRVGFDEGYPPANFWDETGKLKGIDADFLTEIAELTGIEFEFVKMASWTAAVNAVRHQELDMVTCLTRTPEREAFLAFTEVYFDFPIAIITPSDAEFYSTPAAMKGKKVAVPDGFVSDKVMQRIGWDVEVMRVPTITDAYLAVSTGKCYATVANLGNASYLIPRLGITNLKISGVMPEFTRSRFAVRKDWEPLVGIIDKYFATLSELERSAVVERWVRLEVPRASDWRLPLRVGGGLLLVVVVMIGFAFWRNRQLRIQLAEREKYQAAVEEAHSRVTRLSEEKSDLLHMVAHDMRGPLTAFQIGVSHAKERLALADKAEVEAMLLQMERQTEAMKSLIDGVFEAEAIENGSRRINRRSVNYRACVERVIEHCQSHARSKKITLEWSAPVGELKVWGDLVAVRQVVENLVSNALKYSPMGGHVALKLIEQETEVIFEVSDQGAGISPDEFPQLFKKFGRLSARPTHGESSHGLGLYIVKTLTTAMKGRVWCESQLGRGTTFRIALARVT